jgi:NarL family two-component system sensor histidine kinase YdfH
MQQTPAVHPARHPIPDTAPPRDEVWLYVLMLLVPAAVYGWLLYCLPALRTPPRLIGFSALFLVHGALYLVAVRLPRHPRWLYAYCAVQAALVFVISLLTADAPQQIALFLYGALTAQMVGLFHGQLRATLLVASGLLSLAVVTHLLLWGRATLPGFLIPALPMTAFMMALVYLFIQQAQARRAAQGLLHELAATNQQLAASAARVEALTLLTERQRIARELHDTLAQGLAGLILQLEAVESHLGRGNAGRAQTIVSQAMQRARTTLADARRAIDDLRIGDLALDVNRAVCEELDRFAEATGIPCSSALNAPSRLPSALHETIVRTVSEGLTNIARHAHARQVWVQLEHDAQTLTLAVRDDGVGFDRDNANRRNGHYGLVGLCQRAHLAGGSLDITSRPGAGTTLTLHLPLLAFAANEAARSFSHG